MTTTHVRRVEWMTCMKKRMTSTALIVAMSSAIGVFTQPRSIGETHHGQQRADGEREEDGEVDPHRRDVDVRRVACSMVVFVSHGATP